MLSAPLTCRPRLSFLRCAYCHDSLDGASSWSCERCATRLHPDCRELALECPLLGCRPRPVISVRPHTEPEPPPRATLALLIWWLATFAGVWSTLLWVVPRATQIFDKRKAPPPPPTEILRELARFSHSGLGVGTGVLVVVLSVFVFVKFRERPVTPELFVALTIAGLALFGFVLTGGFVPLVNMARV